MMFSEPEDIRQRAGWDGAAGTSRRRLLNSLHRMCGKICALTGLTSSLPGYIPSSVMIPQRRFSTLLHQARSYQQQQCVYHNSPSNSTAFSLYTDHQCNKSAFPRLTTNILDVHTDEVWNLEWSHDGVYLATASKDKTAIIWRLGVRRSSAPEGHHLSCFPTAVRGRPIYTRMDQTSNTEGSSLSGRVFGMVDGRPNTSHQRGALHQSLER